MSVQGQGSLVASCGEGGSSEASKAEDTPVQHDQEEEEGCSALLSSRREEMRARGLVQDSTEAERKDS